METEHGRSQDGMVACHRIRHIPLHEEVLLDMPFLDRSVLGVSPSRSMGGDIRRYNGVGVDSRRGFRNIDSQGIRMVPRVVFHLDGCSTLDNGV